MDFGVEWYAASQDRGIDAEELPRLETVGRLFFWYSIKA